MPCTSIEHVLSQFSYRTMWYIRKPPGQLTGATRMQGSVSNTHDGASRDQWRIRNVHMTIRYMQ